MTRRSKGRQGKARGGREKQEDAGKSKRRQGAAGCRHKCISGENGGPDLEGGHQTTGAPALLRRGECLIRVRAREGLHSKWLLEVWGEEGENR